MPDYTILLVGGENVLNTLIRFARLIGQDKYFFSVQPTKPQIKLAVTHNTNKTQLIMTITQLREASTMYYCNFKFADNVIVVYPLYSVICIL